MVALFGRKDPDFDLTAGIIELVLGVITAPVSFVHIGTPLGLVFGVLGVCLLALGTIDTYEGGKALASLR